MQRTVNAEARASSRTRLITPPTSPVHALSRTGDSSRKGYHASGMQPKKTWLFEMAND
jgi:hypothetical protein